MECQNNDMAPEVVMHMKGHPDLSTSLSDVLQL